MISKEYIECNQIKSNYDFCYLDLFKCLKPNESVSQICEGFGTIGLRNIKGVPFLVKSNNEEVNLLKLLEENKH